MKSSSKHENGWRLGLAPLVAVALVLAASCGSDDTTSDAVTDVSSTSDEPVASGDSAPTGDDSVPSEATDPASDDPVAAEMSRLDGLLAPMFDRPTSIGITEPLSDLPTGKSVYYLECGAEPCKVIGDAIAEAAEALGVDLTRVDSGGSPETFVAAAQAAIDAAPDGVLMASMDKAIIGPQLEELEAMGIPVVNWATGDSAADFTQFLLSPPLYEDIVGPAMARYMIRDALERGDGPANIVYMQVPIFSFTAGIAKGIEETVSAECPDCTFTVLDAQLDEVGGAIPQRIVSHIQANPDTNYVSVMGGFMLIGVPEALAAAGLEDGVHTMSQAGTTNNYADLAAGTQLASIETDLDLIGWYAMDSLARALQGDDPQQVVRDLELPWNQIIEQGDIDFDPNTDRWHAIPDFADQFRELWGT